MKLRAQNVFMYKECLYNPLKWTQLDAVSMFTLLMHTVFLFKDCTNKSSTHNVLGLAVKDCTNSSNTDTVSLFVFKGCNIDSSTWAASEFSVLDCINNANRQSTSIFVINDCINMVKTESVSAYIFSRSYHYCKYMNSTCSCV